VVGGELVTAASSRSSGFWGADNAHYRNDY
jgi:hypothetical protein